ncbi:MAG: thiamine-phosphate kinase [Rhizobiales bacterium 65-9]|nr:thiamine-phosphate kinase [Hyphomicrobiales bacterium]OJY36779.1 MAG: thiamine-phosphate kinase [Rhizobiales bacterium 65-9]
MAPSAEDDLIATYFAPIAGAAGLGLVDDAALMTPPAGCDLVVTVDGVSQGRHFLDDPPETIARKALRVNLSDLAAKGADPLGFVLMLATPASWSVAARAAFLKPFAAALGEDARAYGCPLIGGDTIAADGPLTLAITAFGAVPKGRMVPRTGARAGDLIVVSGTIGDAALGLKLRRALEKDARGASALLSLSQAHQDYLLDAYRHPRPRNALATALRDYAHAAMDVSDGLVGDVVKMLRASGVGGVIEVEAAPLSDAARAALALDPALLRTVATGGDDYEVAACCSEAEWPALRARAEAAGVPFTPIGQAGARGEAVSVAPARWSGLLASGSFSHF